MKYLKINIFERWHTYFKVRLLILSAGSCFEFVFSYLVNHPQFYIVCLRFVSTYILYNTYLL
jgi:hypothetical protein